ncbi:hypothetical protein BVY01_04015 [bacterium I07]|nr:hypothetical protein BVY01_04015 [bacterium I07]
MNTPRLLTFIGKCFSTSFWEDDEMIFTWITENLVNWRQVVYTASNHFVLPALWSTSHANGLIGMMPVDLQIFIERIRSWNLERNKIIINQTAELVAVLNQVGIEPVILKGVGHLLSGLYVDLADRMVADLDIMVPWASLPCTVRELKKIGYQYKRKDIDIDWEKAKHDLPLTCPGHPLRVEIHVRPVTKTCKDILPVDEVWNESELRSMGAGRYRIMSPTHLMLHNMVHSQIEHKSCFMGMIPFRQLYDLYRMIQKNYDIIDWPHIHGLLLSERFVLPFGLYFDMLGRFFHPRVQLKGERPLTVRVSWIQISLLARFRLLIILRLLLARVFHYCILIVQFHISVQERKRIVKRLQDPGWIWDHGAALVEIFKTT